MPGFMLRTLITGLGLWLASALIPGIDVAGAGSLLAAAVLLGVVNAVVRPVVVLLTLPVTIMTLGLFLLVVNAAMLGLVAWLLPGFRVSGLLAAIAGSLVVSITSWIASWYVGPRGYVDVLVVRGAEERR